MPNRSLSPSAWRWLRRGSQALFLAGATALVVVSLGGEPGRATQAIVERFSPLLAVTSMAAARAVLLAFWPALLVVLLSVTLGRAFCGWVCPLGTLIDAADALFARILPRRYRNRRWRREADAPRNRQWRLLVLLALVVTAAFGVQISGWFDPLSIWPRTVAVSLFSYGRAATADRGGVGFEIEEPAPIPDGHLAITLVLAAILLLGLLRRRFYCRYLCPTGGLLSLVGWGSRLRRRVAPGACDHCTRCAPSCRMGAIHRDGVGTAMADCTLCMDCLEVASCRAATFGFAADATTRAVAPTAPALPRRAFLAASAGGAAAVALVPGAMDARPGAVIRPPGAQDEEAHLDRCVACGECMRACPTRGLVPVQLEAGPAALWTPRLVPRVGPCEFDCVRCIEVCPTGAIAPLTLPEKQKAVIGVAVIDRKTCLPWKDEKVCVICWKFCPVRPNAIDLRLEGKLERPYLLEAYCIGCGICEHLCPTDPRAIRVEPPSSAPRSLASGDAGRLVCRTASSSHSRRPSRPPDGVAKSRNSRTMSSTSLLAGSHDVSALGERNFLHGTLGSGRPESAVDDSPRTAKE